jgi:NADPH:quinone reductase-like Zn-dependent oxidoreductase
MQKPTPFGFTVPYGGLRDIDLKPGETIIIAPAAGSFGGAAVKLALAMGALVIAVGRNPEALKKLAASYERI